MSVTKLFLVCTFIITTLMATESTEVTVDSCGLIRNNDNKMYQAFVKDNMYYVKTTKANEWKRIDLLKDFNFTDYFTIDCNKFTEVY